MANFFEQLMQGGNRYSAPYNVPQINQSTQAQILSPFGISPVSHVNPFLFFNDQNDDGSPSWAAQHPRFARAIEGGMIGASTPSADTVGGNISNIARSLLGTRDLYRQNSMNQVMAPFAMASQISPLVKIQQEMENDRISRNMHMAMTDMYSAYAKKAANPPKVYGTPMPAKLPDDSGTGYFQPDLTEGSEGKGVFSTDPNDQYVHAMPKPGSGRKGGGTEAERMVDRENEKRYANGLDAYDSDAYNQRVSFWEGHLAGKKGYAGTAGRQAADLSGGGTTDVEGKQLETYKTDLSNSEAELSKLEGLKISQIYMRYPGSPDPEKAYGQEHDRLVKQRDAAKETYNNYVNGIQPTRPNVGRNRTPKPAANAPQGITFNPNGSITLPPPAKR